MKEKLSFHQNLLIGSLLFGLFFGAGNLIFPVKMGQDAGSNSLWATIGFLITGVGLPIFGIMASALSESESLFDMAKPVHVKYSIFFTCALYLTIGPLFAIPRTATVAFEVGMNPFIPKEQLKIGLLIFSLIFFLLTLYFSLRPGRILDWVGKYLTPIFLVLLSILLIATYVKPMGQVSQYPPQENYMGATSLGSVNRADNGGAILSLVSEHYFGVIGKALLAGIVGVACLKTAIGLITSCAEMFSAMFPNSISYRNYAILFTVFSFIIANFGLTNIIQLSVPVLMFLYPLAITLILLSLLAPLIHKQSDVYKWTTGFTGVAAFFDLCKALPEPLQNNAVIKSIMNFAHGFLPGFDYGFGWILPAFIGFFIGFMVWKTKKAAVM